MPEREVARERSLVAPLRVLRVNSYRSIFISNYVSFTVPQIYLACELNAVYQLTFQDTRNTRYKKFYFMSVKISK